MKILKQSEINELLGISLSQTRAAAPAAVSRPNYPDFDKAVRQYKTKYSGREFKDKVFQSLIRKGYKMSDIIAIWEDKYL